MNFSALSQNDRLALGAAVVVVITALLSLSNDWGLLMAVSLLAGLAVLAVVFQPQVAPAMKLPTSRGLALLALSALAVLATGLTAINWLGWILGHLVSFDTIQFLVGLVAALVMAWAGWGAYQADGPATSTATASGPPPEAPAPPPPPAAEG